MLARCGLLCDGIATSKAMSRAWAGRRGCITASALPRGITGLLISGNPVVRDRDASRHFQRLLGAPQTKGRLILFKSLLRREKSRFKADFDFLRKNFLRPLMCWYCVLVKEESNFS